MGGSGWWEPSKEMQEERYNVRFLQQINIMCGQDCILSGGKSDSDGCDEKSVIFYFIYL